MTDASGTTTYGYHPTNNRLISKVTPQGTLSYGYDPVGDVTSVSSYAGGVNTAYGYDVLNRMSSVTATSDAGQISNVVTNYTYDPVGNLASVAYPNGVSHTYNYNRLNSLTNLNTIFPTVQMSAEDFDQRVANLGWTRVPGRIR